MVEQVSSAAGMHRGKRIRITQESVVFLIAVAIFVAFALFLPGFASSENLLSLIQNVSILGILGVAMAVVVIGRGIDLAMVTTMALSTAWAIGLMNAGQPPALAMLLGLGFAAATGLTLGLLVAYVEIPAIFATLAMSTVIYGFGRLFLVDLDVTYLPEDAGWLRAISGQILGIPLPVIWFALVALLAWAFLKYTRLGRYIYAMGDNREAARITGIPVRPMTVLQYLLSSVVAFGAGIISASLLATVNIRVAQSTMVYDVILVVVLGGIGLSGGKGGVRNVIVGTLLIGILLNGMTILDISFTLQNLVKGAVLLVAIIVDSLVNPRDEQTAQQGDI